MLAAKGPAAVEPARASGGPSGPRGAITDDYLGAIHEGQRLAAFTGRAPSSADLLLGLVRAGGAAARLLAERGVTSTRLESLLPQLRAEPPLDLSALDRASHEICAHLGAHETTSLHLLLALLRAGGNGVELLRRAEQDPARLRAVVLRTLTGPNRSPDRARPRAPAGQVAAAAAPRRGAGRAAPPVLATVDERTEPNPGTEPQESDVTEGGARLEAHEGRSARLRPRSDGSSAAGGDAASTPPGADGARGAPALPPSGVSPGVAAPSSGGAELAPVDLVFLAPPPSPVVGREREIGRLLDLLRTQTARIACVVGDPGAGRTAVVRALAEALPETLAVPVEGPPAGTTVGAWLEALHRRAAPSVPIVIDGCPGLGGESGDGVAQLLATARAGRRWVLTATPADVRRFELHAAELASSLEKVVLSPLPPEALFDAVDAGLGHIAAAAGVRFAPEVCRTLLRLSSRYPSDSLQPGRALTIAEIAAARAGRLGRARVTDNEIADVIAAAADVPLARLLRTDDERFRTLEERLAERVVGHDEARARIADVLRRAYAGFRGRRPLASMLLLGPTGVGKTETARAIADALFDGESALLRIDLSEYNEPHSVARLIGSPPGYVGFEDGGQLTEGIRRRPASVVLLDELEKAHKEVLLLLLQVLEDGRLTDGRGRTVDFSAAAIVMTSNLGSECYRQKRAPSAATIQALARTRLPPELWNRIDEVLCYRPLGEKELAQVVTRIAADSSRRLEGERGISFRVDESVIDAVLEAETDRTLGARPLRRAFERMVEGTIASQILSGHVRKGARLFLEARPSGELVVAYDR